MVQKGLVLAHLTISPAAASGSEAEAFPRIRPASWGFNGTAYLAVTAPLTANRYLSLP